MTSKDEQANTKEIEEMGDMSHSLKLHPGSTAVVMLAESLLQAVMTVVATAKDRKGLQRYFRLEDSKKMISNHCCVFEISFLPFRPSTTLAVLISLDTLSTWAERCWRRFVCMFEFAPSLPQHYMEQHTHMLNFKQAFKSLLLCYRLFPKLTDSELPWVLVSVLRRMEVISDQCDPDVEAASTKSTMPLILWTELVRCYSGISESLWRRFSFLILLLTWEKKHESTAIVRLVQVGATARQSEVWRSLGRCCNTFCAASDGTERLRGVNIAPDINEMGEVVVSRAKIFAWAKAAITVDAQDPQTLLLWQVQDFWQWSCAYDHISLCKD